MSGIAFAPAYGSVSVASIATLILATNPLRKGVIVMNNSAANLYIGMDANVTVNTGLPIVSGGSFASNDFGGVWKGAIWGVAAAGNADTRYWEFGP